MTNIEVMKQALEAFSGLLTFNPTGDEYAKGREAVVALRAAIAEQEKAHEHRSNEKGA